MKVGKGVACRRRAKHKMCDGNLCAIDEIEEWSARMRRRLLAPRSYLLEQMLGCRCRLIKLAKVGAHLAFPNVAVTLTMAVEVIAGVTVLDAETKMRVVLPELTRRWRWLRHCRGWHQGRR